MLRKPSLTSQTQTLSLQIRVIIPVGSACLVHSRVHKVRAARSKGEPRLAPLGGSQPLAAHERKLLYIPFDHKCPPKLNRIRLPGGLRPDWLSSMRTDKIRQGCR